LALKKTFVFFESLTVGHNRDQLRGREY
jgi:hypothetical protein